jgi:hypothetical protein
MSMEITIDPYLPFLNLGNLLKHEFCEVNLRIIALIRVDPLPVQIDSSSRVSIIAANHTIRVQARY